MKRLKYLPKI